jgi:hypothetical protein
MRRTIDIYAFLLAMLLVACGGCTQSPSSEPNSRATQGGSEPPLDQMKLAKAAGKLSVPVDVRYRVGAVSAPGQAVSVDLAFVPRIRGENLTVEFPQSDAVTIDAGNISFTQQKAAPDQVIRRTLLVTPQRSGGTEVRVLVSMNVEAGRFFGVFSVPIEK